MSAPRFPKARRAGLALGLATLACTAPAALGAQETIASDRPGIGSGAYVLGPGTVQLETGIEYAATPGGHEWAFGQGLVRIGAPGMEFEFFVNSYVVSRDFATFAAPGREGWQDLGAGVKLPLVRGGDEPLTLSLQGIVLAPSGSDGFSNEGWAAAVNALADVALGDALTLSVNVGYQGGGELTDDVASLIVTPSLALGDRVGAYGGYALSSDGWTHILEGGLTFLPDADLQLDVNGGYDVESDDYFLGAGLALRRRRR